MIARITALAVAAIVWLGLIVQFSASLSLSGHDPLGALWAMLCYFTIWTNIGVAILFTALAIGRTVQPLFVGGVTLAILLVGIVYGLLLRGLLDLSGGALLADTLLHKVTPLIVPFWWLGFARKGELDWVAPWRWALFPTLYLPYALARGMAGGRYAYPFINLDRLGWSGVAVNAAAIARGFLAAGHALVALDQRMGRR